MTRSRLTFRCSACGSVAPQWVGRCGSCGEWDSVGPDDVTNGPDASDASHGTWAAPRVLADVPSQPAGRVETGIDELDRVLGGGFVPGSTILIGGEPGIGKSTLLLQALLSLAGRGVRSFLVAAEEAPERIRDRADRLGGCPTALSVQAETSLEGILQGVALVGPDVLVIDSIHAVRDQRVPGVAGSVTQVRACAQALAELARERGIATALIGHVTKDGELAGPRTLEHVVDTVLSFEGDRHHALRLLRASKHRFGATGEIGLFELGEDGLRCLPDAGGLLLGDRRHAPGSVVVAGLEGTRPLLVEVQALVAPSGPAGSPSRRSAQGVDSARVGVLLAVLHRRAGLPLSGFEVFVSAAGGIRLREPAADLGLLLAMASSALARPMPADTVVCGEVGLAGEVRQVPQIPRRLAEASRLGFARAVVPASFDGPAPIALERVSTVAEALDLLEGCEPEAFGRPGLVALP